MVKEKIEKTISDKPVPYELVSLVIQRKDLNGKTIEKTIKGWWMGNQWYGRRLQANDKVLGWERGAEFHG